MGARAVKIKQVGPAFGVLQGVIFPFLPGGVRKTKRFGFLKRNLAIDIQSAVCRKPTHKILPIFKGQRVKSGGRDINFPADPLSGRIPVVRPMVLILSNAGSAGSTEGVPRVLVG